MNLSDYSIHAWIQQNGIKNEKGEPIEFLSHLFLYDIYRDQSDKLVCMKAAQIGFSTLAILKNMYDAQSKRMDIIYTLPTDTDVSVFVGGKVNRIIANNRILMNYTADKDSVEQKAIGHSMLYFRGTWTKKAAIMVSADRLVHDEKDSSKQDVIRDYQSRLQHSKYKQTHVFSHPSVPGHGVDSEWQLSDKKEWYITCPHCRHEQSLSWDTEDLSNMSIDLARKEFICKKCCGILSAKNRAVGRWIAQNPGAEWSGYHISLLMAPWITAKEIVEKYNDPKQTTEYFYNKVLGLPYAGSGNVVTEDTILGVVANENNQYEGRLVIGVDTGKKLHYVVGNKAGLIGYGEMADYAPDGINGLQLNQTLEYFLKEFEGSIMVIDQGGDIIGPRKLRAKYPGRVFLCHYAKDRKTMQMIRWGEGDESGNVLVDRNRMIQLVVDEFKERRLNLFQKEKNDWYDYWLHWSHIYRTREEDELGIPQSVWHRSDRDDWVHATIYWRVGIDRFGSKGFIANPEAEIKSNSYMIDPDETVSFDPAEMFNLKPHWWTEDEDEDDWRNDY
ncbi:MAG: hypothetical protein A2427_02605 [Candidatus Nealsonbacteria bacterium RIFOXYC1_FULL_40_7]|uniref:Phage terminase large subunit GpA ATPase domain-containing protein n=1 Tax=Candidatus Nealsonbacteria bacterium RIFOXYC1_FULL_40_7 TaxID=1801678 RepID=A0A1G2ES92_9BACT|nr:MAG: hypothetical protein A2427_02605 [Candidatus Nealsonbacteria bacterium RIFOXYC1_FULL_40_7]OGZ28986.1 MAG: hypothetical protein A2562_01760 [Candidatus Nealsonbacteria bacterium RIFOXYD1_FULL_39_11]